MNPDNRRPIAARQWALSRRLASWLAARAVSPDAISVAGMIAGLAAGLALAFAGRNPILWLPAAVLIGLRLLANMLDGMVAIERGVASKRGELFNELPDRVSDSAILVGLGLAADALALGLGAALAAMATAYVRAVGQAARARADFRGPFAKQQRMALVIAVCVYAAGATAWGGAITPVVIVALWVLIVGAVVTALRRMVGIAAALGRS